MGNQRSNPDANEIPVHTVTIPSFQVMKTEVTVGIYRECVDAGQCSEPSTGSYFCNWNYMDREDHPINCINWYQSNELAAWVGARLLTESEQEYVARGQGRDVLYPWGDDAPTCDLAVYDTIEGGGNCEHRSTLPVCSKPSGNTPQGVCDMAGNVWEWVQDEGHDNYEEAPTDGSGWCTSICPVNASDSNYDASDSTDRVLRGGSWGYNSSVLRATARSNFNPSGQYSDVGVRFARTIP